MEFKRKQVAVTVRKVLQPVQYCPCEVAVTEVAEIPPGADAEDVKAELYKSASASVQKFMTRELKKWKETE